MREKRTIEISTIEELKEILEMCDSGEIITLTIETGEETYEWRGSTA